MPYRNLNNMENLVQLSERKTSLCFFILKFNRLFRHKVKICQFTFVILLFIFAKVCDGVFFDIQINNGCVDDKVMWNFRSSFDSDVVVFVNYAVK